jgi:Tfp pilus assembly protein PilX
MLLKKIKIIDTQRGITLILTLIVMGLLLFLGAYFMSFSATDFKISHSHAQAEQGYYLAEAGLHEMMYKLKNDDSYRIPFETDPAWSATLTRNNVFNSGESYSISVKNSSVAHAELLATSSISLLGPASAQRVAQTNVFKALGTSPVKDSAGYADGNIDLSASTVNFYDGSAHSNNVFNINGGSIVHVYGNLNAVGNYNKSASIVTIDGETHAQNYPPAAEAIDMPAIDFDSISPNSYKNRAIASSTYYTSAAFETLMRNNQNLTLNGITYVETDVELRGGQNLTINGVLAVGRDIIVGKDLCWVWGFLQGHCGFSSITVNHTAGQPAGIMAKRKIYFQTFAGQINIAGIAYANDQMSIVGLPVGMDFKIHGGLVSRKLTITGFWRPVDIYYDNEILSNTLGATEFSPVINVDHWEEEY